MPVFTSIKDTKPSKVHYSEYIRTENKPEETVAKPADPKTPEAS